MIAESEHAAPPAQIYDFCPLCGNHLRCAQLREHIMREHERSREEAEELIAKDLTR